MTNDRIVPGELFAKEAHGAPLGRWTEFTHFSSRQRVSRRAPV